MNKNLPWYYSTVAIVLAFLFFWPLGIVLLILRNSSNKQSVFLGSTDKKKYIIAGVILILIGISLFSSKSFFMGFFMIIGGIALIVYAEKLKRKALRNRQYIDLIVNQGQTSLDSIANMCNINYDLVVKELRSLTSLGVLKNAVIDENYRTITVQNQPAQALPQNWAGVVPGETDSFAGTASQSTEEVMCVCPGCGAKVALRKGAAINCEYCDMPIVAK